MRAEWREELGLLASVLCDGGLTPEQATRLEQIAGDGSVRLSVIDQPKLALVG